MICKNNIYYVDYICQKKSSRAIDSIFLNIIRQKFNYRVQSKIISDNIIQFSSICKDDIDATIEIIQKNYDI